MLYCITYTAIESRLKFLRFEKVEGVEFGLRQVLVLVEASEVDFDSVSTNEVVCEAIMIALIALASRFRCSRVISVDVTFS